MKASLLLAALLGAPWPALGKPLEPVDDGAVPPAIEHASTSLDPGISGAVNGAVANTLPTPPVHPSPTPELLDHAPRVLSEIELDLNIVPRPHSTIPGYQSEVEQCGEFVYRYFTEHGLKYPANYPTLGQPAEYILHGPRRPDFPAFKNGGSVAPRAGDILAAIGPPGSGQYHTALIWKVQTDAVWVYQANVPLGNASPHWLDHLMRFPLTIEGGLFTMPPLKTSTLGYRHDMSVVGWIHPAGSRRLSEED